MSETPPQTVGPFLSIGLTWPNGHLVVPEGSPGALRISGVLRDGAGEPVADGMVETWQADAEGRFDHPDDPRGPSGSGFGGFGRCPTDAEGRFQIVTLKPGALGDGQAPHIDVSVFARGLLDRVVTRIYFADEAAANAEDVVLESLPDDASRATLIAQPSDDGYVLDIHLQSCADKSMDETVFFAV
jgi:protocatechuate 3,4-dioxygenase, alpha subunit